MTSLQRTCTAFKSYICLQLSTSQDAFFFVTSEYSKQYYFVPIQLLCNRQNNKIPITHKMDKCLQINYQKHKTLIWTASINSYGDCSLSDCSFYWSRVYKQFILLYQYWTKSSSNKLCKRALLLFSSYITLFRI